MSRIACDGLNSDNDSCFDARGGGIRGFAAAFEASFEAVSHLQDAPRASSASNRLLAITMLAKPKRLQSCAAFFARPL